MPRIAPCDPGSRSPNPALPVIRMPACLRGTVLEHVGKLPDPQCEIFIAQMGGATKRVPADATAYRHRDAEFVMKVHRR